MVVNDVRLGTFDGSGFNKGAGTLKTILWYFVNALIVRASWNPFMGIKIALLRAFGAKIGKGLVIKNNVIIKSPWNLVVGDDCWLGESCWIDNLIRLLLATMHVSRKVPCSLQAIMTIRYLLCLIAMHL